MANDGNRGLESRARHMRQVGERLVGVALRHRMRVRVALLSGATLEGELEESRGVELEDGSATVFAEDVIRDDAGVRHVVDRLDVVLVTDP